MKSNVKVYVQAITAAIVSRRAAFQQELAVTFAILLETDANKRLSKETLVTVYDSCGYQCANPGDRDWLSINRRIRAGFALFDFIGHAEVTAWAGTASKGALIDAFVAKLAPLKLATVNEVLTVTEKVAKPRTRLAAPAGSAIIETSHMRLVIPPNVTRMELMEAAAQLMTLAQRMERDVAPVPEPEAVAA